MKLLTALTVFALGGLVTPAHLESMIKAQQSTDTDMMLLAATDSQALAVSADLSPLYSKSEPVGICLMVLGVVSTVAALVVLWSNEKRAVRYSSMVERAELSCVTVDPSRPLQNNLFKLVHLAGTTHNKEDLQDLDFGVVAQDSYRLRRKVEMFQWCETFVPASSSRKACYTYAKQWSEDPIDSTMFKNLGFDNPSIYSWPYTSHCLQGQKV